MFPLRIVIDAIADYYLMRKLITLQYCVKLVRFVY